MLQCWGARPKFIRLHPMEEQVRRLGKKLSDKDWETIASYLDIRDELEYQSVKQALRFSKYVK